MGIFEYKFPLGFGTNHFNVSGVDDLEGIERSARLVLHALDSGVKYIDTSHTYSRGMSHSVLKRAFQLTSQPFDVTVKSQLGMDFTSDDTIRRVEGSLTAMGINRATHFICWNITSYFDFEEIMRKGGIYEGADKCKREGLIDHIGFSTHAPIQDIKRIIASGMFEAVTLSYSLLNSAHMNSVLDVAQDYGVGVVVMNPLGGGIIPQNRDYFAFVRNEQENNTVQAALRFVASQPGVDIVLAGPSSIEEFEENYSAFVDENTENDTKRITRVNAKLKTLESFCTGCHYCDGCPVNIPVYEYMQSRNNLLFEPAPYYRQSEPELCKNIWMFKKLSNDFSIIPDTPENPCIRCGKCEKKCTQNLKIMDALDDTYTRIMKTSYSLKARKERLNSLLGNKSYKKIGFYPGGGYTSTCNKKFFNLVDESGFEKVAFDSNPKLWGTQNGDMEIYSPDAILDIRPDCILICNFLYSDEIFEQIKHYQDYGIDILKLHDTDDVPWVM